MIPDQLDVPTDCPGGEDLEFTLTTIAKINLQPAGGCSIKKAPYLSVLRSSVLNAALRLAPALFKWYCREVTPLAEHWHKVKTINNFTPEGRYNSAN